MAPLSPWRSLPGRVETGLTAPQKHFAIALGRLLWAQGSGIVSLEMGAGKTTIALAVAEYLQTTLERRRSTKSVYPVLVVGPGIVTGEENWPKEVREVIPGAVARVVDIAAKPVPKPARVKDWAKALGIHLDESRFAGLPPKAAWLEIVNAAQKQEIPLSREHALRPLAYPQAGLAGTAAETDQRQGACKLQPARCPHRRLSLVGSGGAPPRSRPCGRGPPALQPGPVPGGVSFRQAARQIVCGHVVRDRQARSGPHPGHGHPAHPGPGL